jgi:hypothetical protein
VGDGGLRAAGVDERDVVVLDLLGHGESLLPAGTCRTIRVEGAMRPHGALGQG